MISTMGRKIFYIHPPKSLEGSFLEQIFQQEFEIYLLESKEHIVTLLDKFKDAIVFINIDHDLDYVGWATYIAKLNHKFKDVIITVFSKKNSDSFKKTFLFDIGITGGYIHLEEDNWKTVELISKVLEATKARGRRKTVRLDFNANTQIEELSVKVFTVKGYSVSGSIKSMSSAGVLVGTKGRVISDEDDVERIIFTVGGQVLQLQASVLKRFDNGDSFISFKGMDSGNKQHVQSYIFDTLQKSFQKLINTM